MNEIEYILARFDEKFSRWKGSRIVLHGTREYARAIIERYDAEYGFDAVATADLPADSVFCGKPVIADEDLEELHPDIVIMTERVRHAEAVYQKIGGMCSQAGIDLFDMYGLDWIALRLEIDAQQPQTLAGWLAIAESYDVVAFEAPGPLLKERIVEGGTALAVRPDTRRLVRLLQDKGKTVLFIGRAPYTAEQQKAAIAASDMVPEGSSIDDLFFMREGEDGAWHAIRRRYPEERILNIGYGIPKECILPRYYDASSYRMLYGDNLLVESTRAMQRIIDLSLDGPRLRQAVEEAVDAADIVSFDVFDTLLVRSVCEPEEIFPLVEQRALAAGMPVQGFSRVRAKAQTAFDNPSFEQIYRYVQSKMNLPEDDLVELMQIEFEVETASLSARESVCSLMRGSVEKGKAVYLVSDMYFSSEQIEHLLAKNGIAGYTGLFVSCEQDALKRDGLLGKLLELGVPADRVVHMGDSLADDIQPALDLGLDAILLPSARDLAQAYDQMPSRWTEESSEEDAAIRAKIIRDFADPFEEHAVPVRVTRAAWGELPMTATSDARNTQPFYEKMVLHVAGHEEDVPVDLRRALLSWYRFPGGERMLFLGSDRDAFIPVLEQHYTTIDYEIAPGARYDCIIMLDPLDNGIDLERLLKRIAGALAPDGILLMGTRNRYGIKYLCGGIDAVAAVPFSPLARSGCPGMLGRTAAERVLGKQGLAVSHTYNIMPDASYAQAVYADEFVPHGGIQDRIQPFDTSDSPLIASEHALYAGIVEEGLFPALANYFVFECRGSNAAEPEKQVLHATLALDRGPELSYITTVFADDTVLKAPAYGASSRNLEVLAANHRELAARGIDAIGIELSDEGAWMPFVRETPLTSHIDALLAANPASVIDVFRLLYDDVLRSSPASSLSEEDARRIWRCGAAELGPILEKGYIDMVPYNAFWNDGKLRYIDQEFTLERCPAKFVLFRALRYTWIHLPHAEDAIGLGSLKEEFGLTRLWNAFTRFDDAFVDEVHSRNPFLQQSCINAFSENAMEARRARLLHPELSDGLGDAARRADDGKPYGVGLLMGAFDLFHVGHLRLIERAKERCGFLRVAVLDDATVMKYKGITPAIPLEQRMEVLAAISDVDEVVAIHGDPSRIKEWHRRPFDCFFSGDDHADDGHWKQELEMLRALGSNIEFFPYTEEQSTTKIRDGR